VKKFAGSLLGPKKVFIEGDAIILAIFETEATQGDARSGCQGLLPWPSRFLSVCNSYKRRDDHDALAPAGTWDWHCVSGIGADLLDRTGDARIMISKALNLSDRLSGCAKLAKRMLAGQKKTHFFRVPVF